MGRAKHVKVKPNLLLAAAFDEMSYYQAYIRSYLRAKSVIEIAQSSSAWAYHKSSQSPTKSIWCRCRVMFLSELRHLF